LSLFSEAKVSGKIDLVGRVDKVLVGGGMAFTFIKAMGYEIGDSLVEDAMLETAERIRKKLVENNVKFYLPVDCVIAQNTEPGAVIKIVPTLEIPKGWKALDIGPASVKLYRCIV
jgi:phosphoglycerate kinase